MSLFGKKKVDAKTISRWIASVESNAELKNFREMRKNLQSVMFNEISDNILPVQSEFDGKVTYLMVHMISGRSLLPDFGPMLDASPEAANLARALFEQATSDPPASEQFQMTAWLTCGVEIANEAIAENYDAALTLADYGVKTWPTVAEIWHARGILKIAKEHFRGAAEDLLTAQDLDPKLPWLHEPLEYAQARCPGGPVSRPSRPSHECNTPKANNETGGSSPATKNLGTLMEVRRRFLGSQGHETWTEPDNPDWVFFKANEIEFSVYVGSDDKNYFLLRCYVSKVESAEDREKLARVLNSINLHRKGVRTYFFETDDVSIEIGQFLSAPDDFEAIFPRAFDQLLDSLNDFVKGMDDD